MNESTYSLQLPVEILLEVLAILVQMSPLARREDLTTCHRSSPMTCSAFCDVSSLSAKRAPGAAPLRVPPGSWGPCSRLPAAAGS